MEVKIAYVEGLEASLLQLASATTTTTTNPSDGIDAAAAAASAAAVGGAGVGGEERGDWGVLVSQDLAVMR